MIKYYSNRELSTRFNLNLARWKRWSREFLPPDALGGFQSGYARQYSRDDAFTVYLGGYLVGEFKFSIPEAKRILSDLFPWMVDAGFYQNGQSRIEPGIEEIVQRYQVFIQPQTGRGLRIEFSYLIRGIVSEDATSFGGHPVRRLLFIEKILPESGKIGDSSPNVLNITDLYKDFVRLLEAGSGKGDEPHVRR